MSARAGFAYGAAVGLVLGVLLAAATGILDELPWEDDPGASAEAREVIEDNYFEEVPAGQLEAASIRGMIGELRERYEDRFSHYFSPQQLNAFQRATSGEFDGIGLAVNEVPQGLRVASVYPDAPAEAAGIEEGDVIVGVDGKSIAGVSAEVSTARIKGPPGTEVRLRIDPADGEPRNVTVERASVRIPAVSGEIRRVDGREVAYVRYETFSRGAHGELREEIERLLREGAEGIALDLRGNGGGLLNEAILSASIFVEDGVIVSTESRTEGDTDYEAVGEAIDPRPMVVITNRDTASASEILAAALQTYDLAEVVGTRTFGKGTFQEVIGLESGGALDLTIGEYLTADGTSIAGEGVKPDVRAPDDERTDRDETLDRALEALGREL